MRPTELWAQGVGGPNGVREARGIAVDEERGEAVRAGSLGGEGAPTAGEGGPHQEQDEGDDVRHYGVVFPTQHAHLGRKKCSARLAG